jgi:hypothetical protein
MPCCKPLAHWSRLHGPDSWGVVARGRIHAGRRKTHTMTYLYDASMAIVVAALAAGCNGNGADPKNPNAPSVEKRDTAIEHEDCDLESGKGLDANGDGRPDIVKVYSGNKEICRAVDINMDAIIDVYIYYDDAGQTRRRESGFDRDKRPDEIAYYQGGTLARKERETNNDQKIDTWTYFEGGRMMREERDSTGDGYVDQWWTFNNPEDNKCALVVTDGDGDGKPDADSEVDLCQEANATKPKPAPEPEPEEEASDKPASGEPAGDDGASKEESPTP